MSTKILPKWGVSYGLGTGDWGGGAGRVTVPFQRDDREE